MKIPNTFPPFVAVLLVAIDGLLPTVQAQTNNWTNAASGFWTNATSWSLGVAPSNNPVVNITSGGGKTVTIDAATPADNLTITNLIVNGSGSANVLYLSGNSTPLNVLGVFQLGSGGAGSLVLDGGNFVTTNASQRSLVGYYGASGIGAMTVSNGTWLANQVGVGWSAPGTLTLAGGTNLIPDLLISQTLSTTGAVVMTGGRLVTTNSAGSASVSVGNIGIGIMTVSNGTWLANQVYVGNGSGSQGALTLAGGTNWLNNGLIIGYNAGATGMVNVTAGNLVITNTGGTAQLVVGVVSGLGTFTLSGGTVTADRLFVTNVNSSFSASGGSLVAKTAAIGSSFSLTNSTGTFSSSLTVNPSGSLSGTNGTFAFYGNFINQSTNRAQFNLSRSTVLFTNGAGGTNAHTLNLTNSGALDMGVVAMNAAQLATNFSIGTLSISLSNRVTLTGMKSGATTNALYVGWLDLSAWTTNAGVTLTNTLLAALSLPDINLYYDASDAQNAYLQDASYALWGGGGLLIPIPEPSVAGLILGGALFSALLLRRQKGRE